MMYFTSDYCKLYNIKFSHPLLFLYSGFTKLVLINSLRSHGYNLLDGLLTRLKLIKAYNNAENLVKT